MPKSSAATQIRGGVGKIEEAHGNVSVCEGAHDDREIVVSGKFEEIGAIAARILLNIYQSAVCEYQRPRKPPVWYACGRCGRVSGT